MSTSTDHEVDAGHGPHTTHDAASGEYDGPAITKESHGGHPSDLQYIYVALFLAVVTGIEVWLSYIGGEGFHKVRPYLLIAAAIIKFGFVAAFFMHLKFDSKNFRRLFGVGVVMALFCYLVVLFSFHKLQF